MSKDTTPNAGGFGGEGTGNEDEAPAFERKAIRPTSQSPAPWIDGRPEPATDKNPERAAAEAEKDELPEADDDLSSGLDSIFRQADDEDMSRIDRGAKARWRRLLIGLATFFGFLTLVSWAGFFLFSPGERKFTGDRVALEISGPPQVRSGDRVEYVIAVRNDEASPLGSASLQLRLPSGFVLAEAEPPLDDSLTYRLGSLSPGSSASVRISGTFLAPIGTQADLQAILNYRPAEFNSEFRKISVRTVGVADSSFLLSAYGPERVMPGDEVAIELVYANDTDSDFRGLRLRTDWPSGFIPERSEPAALDEAMSEWEIAELPARAEGKISVYGSFASDAKGQAGFLFRLGAIDAQGGFGLQKETEIRIDVVEGEMILGLFLNGKTGDQPVAFGDALRYSLSWQNAGESAPEDIALTAVFEVSPAAGLLDWSSLRDEREGRRDGQRLSWRPEQVRSLQRIAPGDGGAIDFDIRLADAPLPGIDSDRYEVAVWIEAEIGSIDGQKVGRQVKTPTARAILVSDAEFLAEARWFDRDGQPIGSGPLPPEAGSTTTYRVEWTVTNGLHDLSDMKVSARLPSNAIWTGKADADAGDLHFEAGEGKVIWTLNWLPTDIGTLRAGFDLAFTPTADHQGKSPTLTEAAIFEARDRNNGYPVILSAPPLTTALPNDQFAAGKGKVR